MTTSAISHPAPARSWVRTTLVLAAAVVVAIALNAAVAAVAVAVGAPTDYGPLTAPAFASMTLVGVLAGWAGWSIVVRRARDPRRVLTVLVPVVAALTFVPDVLLLVFAFIPGTTTAAVLALMAMHLVVLGVAVPAYLLATPRERLRRAA